MPTQSSMVHYFNSFNIKTEPMQNLTLCGVKTEAVQTGILEIKMSPYFKFSDPKKLMPVTHSNN